MDTKSVLGHCCHGVKRKVGRYKVERKAQLQKAVMTLEFCRERRMSGALLGVVL